MRTKCVKGLMSAVGALFASIVRKLSETQVLTKDHKMVGIQIAPHPPLNTRFPTTPAVLDGTLSSDPNMWLLQCNPHCCPPRICGPRTVQVVIFSTTASPLGVRCVTSVFRASKKTASVGVVLILALGSGMIHGRLTRSENYSLGML